MPASVVGWLVSEVAAGWVLAAAWLERGEQSPFIRTARRGIPRRPVLKEEVMFVIGIDPHKRSHTAAVLDDSEELVGQVRVKADRWQRDRLLRFAAPFEPRTWAVEAAGGLGALLAQQLVAAGERVVDVPPTRHRLNPRGNRQLNHALHVAAITQIAHDTPGRT